MQSATMQSVVPEQHSGAGAPEQKRKRKRGKEKKKVYLKKKIKGV